MEKIWGLAVLVTTLGCSADNFTAQDIALVADDASRSDVVKGVREHDASVAISDAGVGTADSSDAAEVKLDASAKIDASDASIADSAVAIDASQPVDASTAIDASGVDASVFVCNDGDSRCDSYQDQVCTSNAWVWQTGKPTCCTDGSRWSITSSTEMVDTKTNLTWYRYVWQGQGVNSKDCALVLAGSATPTMAQYLAISLGQPVVVNNQSYSVCDPTIDQVAFPSPPTTRTYVAADGCFDMLYGVTDPNCTSGVPSAELCVK